MTRLIIFALIFFNISCSTTKTNSYLQSLRPNQIISQNTIPARTQKEARMIIENQINFLKMLFQQSYDPYYNVPKWSEACLQENKIGQVNIKSNIVFATSELYLDKNGEAGHCSSETSARKAWVSYIFCSPEQGVIRVKASKNPAPFVDQQAVCH